MLKINTQDLERKAGLSCLHSILLVYISFRLILKLCCQPTIYLIVVDQPFIFIFQLIKLYSMITEPFEHIFDWQALLNEVIFKFCLFPAVLVIISVGTFTMCDEALKKGAPERSDSSGGGLILLSVLLYIMRKLGTKSMSQQSRFV